MIAWLEEQGKGSRTINYKLRDWLFSRQRYWGEPFPIVWEDGKHARALRGRAARASRHSSTTSARAAPPSRLSPRRRNGSAIPRPRAARSTPCRNGPAHAGITCAIATRGNASRFVGEEAERYWMGGGTPGGVDLYVGGTEHAVLHLLYARFWHKVLFDLGQVSHARAVPAPRQPGHDPRRGRPEDVQEPRQRHQSRRRHRGIRRGRPAPLRDVHGAARADEALEHDRRRGRLPLPRARLASGDGGEPGRRVGALRRAQGGAAREEHRRGSSMPPSRKWARISRPSPSIPPSRR